MIYSSSGGAAFNYFDSCLFYLNGVSRERGKMCEDAGLFSTCTSYSQSSNDDAEL